MIIHEIKCRFCGKITGQIELPEKWWGGQVITNELLGIADVRCEQHEQEFGNFKAMSDEFLRDVGTYDEFKLAIAKSEYKKSKFDVEVAKIQAENALKLGGKLKSKPKSGIIKSNKK